jgi:hypothetical protein
MGASEGAKASLVTVARLGSAVSGAVPLRAVARLTETAGGPRLSQPGQSRPFSRCILSVGCWWRGRRAGWRGCSGNRSSVQVGELCSGTVTAVSQSGQLEVALDGFPGLIGMIGSLDQGWPRPARGEMRPGDRIAAGVIAVDAGEGRVRLSVAAARNRELWTFLSGLRPG